MSNTPGAIFKIFVTIAVLWFLFMIYFAIYSSELCDKSPYEKLKGYYVKTGACKIRDLQYMAKELRRGRVEANNEEEAVAAVTGKECIPPLTRIEGSWLVRNLDGKAIKKIYQVRDDWKLAKCEYTEIKSAGDRAMVYDKGCKFSLTDVAVPLHSHLEFITVQCVDAKGQIFYKNLHFIIDAMHKFGPLNETMHRAAECLTVSRQAQKPKVSVLLLGLDNLTHYDFPKTFPEASAFLKQLPTTVEFWGYTKVANSALGNMFPVLKGVSEFQHHARVQQTLQSKLLGYIWQNYQDCGFSTLLYAENNLLEKMGLDSGLKNADFDFFPYLNESRQEGAFQINGIHVPYDTFCQSSPDQALAAFKVMRQMIPQHKRHHMFSFYWLSKRLPYSRLDDSDFTRTLTQLNRGGVFNQTFVIIVSNPPEQKDPSSDELEAQKHRLPLLLVSYPKFMEREYPLAIHLLRRNAHHLTTPFDLHATLNDLQDLDDLDEATLKFMSHKLLKNYKKGRLMPISGSLFIRSRRSRSCLDAGIPAAFCACHQHGEERKGNSTSRSTILKTIKLF